MIKDMIQEVKLPICLQLVLTLGTKPRLHIVFVVRTGTALALPFKDEKTWHDKAHISDNTN